MFIRKQEGAALIVSMILLTVATIVTVASMRGGTMQEKMTANQNNKAVSLMAAEAGGSAFFDWIVSEFENGTMAWSDPDWQDDWQSVIPSNQAGSHNLGSNGYYWLDPADVSWNADDVVVTLTGQAGPDVNAPLGQTKLRMIFNRPELGGTDPAFLAGLLADGNIDINGNADFTGSAHANGEFNVSGGQNSLNDRDSVDEDGNPVTLESSVSAHGDAKMRRVDQERVMGGADTIEVPSASEYINEKKAGGGVIESCEIPTGDLGGAVYYCDGNARTSGSFSNVTILADGDIDHRGSAQLGASEDLTVMIVAGGDITINGRNDTFGVYWADGNVRQNGRSTIGGSVVAGGDIRRNGVFDYVQYDNFGGLDVPEGPAADPSILSWVEVI